MNLGEAVQSVAKCIDSAPLSKAERLGYEACLQQIISQLNAAEVKIQELTGRLKVAEGAAIQAGEKPDLKLMGDSEPPPKAG